jgi:hypothetical protein
MRLTPAQAHLQRKQAAQAASAAPAGATTEGSAFELLQAQLYEHRQQLKAIQSIERKIEAKREFLPLYEPWIRGVLESGQGAQDLVLTSVWVWALDVGAYDMALDMARYILQHGLTLPDQYQRDPATTLIDEVADASLKGKVPFDVATEVLQQVAQLTSARDVPDQARAKLYKALAYAIVQRTSMSEVDYKELPLDQAQAALPFLLRALELFSGVGVKKDIERLERRVKELTQHQAP